MIYLIGGPPRVGKSNLAQLMLERRGIPYICTDQLVMMLKGGAPDLGVTDEVPPQEKSIALFPHLKHFIKVTNTTFPSFLIEGDALLPEYIMKLRAHYHLQTVYLGTSAMTPKQLRENPAYNNWIERLDDKQVAKLAKWIVEMSKFYQNECFKYRLEYIDMAGDYERNIEKAYSKLSSEI